MKTYYIAYSYEEASIKVSSRLETASMWSVQDFYTTRASNTSEAKKIARKRFSKEDYFDRLCSSGIHPMDASVIADLD